MNIDQLSDLPDWDEATHIYDDENTELWKPNPTLEKCKELYSHWQQLVFLLKGFLLPFTEEQENSKAKSFIKDAGPMLVLDAYTVAAKIRGSEQADLYVVRMENAAIIRQYATHIQLGMYMMKNENTDIEYIDVIIKEIDKFRMLFREWVKTFEIDDRLPDDWGLFV